MNDNPFEKWQQEHDRACGIGSGDDSNKNENQGGEAGCCWILLAMLIPPVIGLANGIHGLVS